MWKSIVIEDAAIGFNLTSGQGDGFVGSVTVIDSLFKNTNVAMLVANTNKSSIGSTAITLDNVVFDNVPTWLRQKDAEGGAKDSNLSGGKKLVDSLTVGRVYSDATLDSSTLQESSTFRAESLLGKNPLNLPKSPYFERPKPQYENAQPGDFVHVKDSCKGEIPP